VLLLSGGALAVSLLPVLIHPCTSFSEGGRCGPFWLLQCRGVFAVLTVPCCLFQSILYFVCEGWWCVIFGWFSAATHSLVLFITGKTPDASLLPALIRPFVSSSECGRCGVFGWFGAETLCAG
jgi:hypothetical protein